MRTISSNHYLNIANFNTLLKKEQETLSQYCNARFSNLQGVLKLSQKFDVDEKKKKHVDQSTVWSKIQYHRDSNYSQGVKPWKSIFILPARLESRIYSFLPSLPAPYDSCSGISLQNRTSYLDPGLVAQNTTSCLLPLLLHVPPLISSWGVFKTIEITQITWNLFSSSQYICYLKIEKRFFKKWKRVLKNSNSSIYL